MTLDQLVDQMHAMIGRAFATPSGGGTPAADAGNGGPPLTLNQMQWFGDVHDTAAGRTAEAIVDLVPGTYVGYGYFPAPGTGIPRASSSSLVS